MCVCHLPVELHNKATLMRDLFLENMNFEPHAIELTLVITDNHETGISSQVSCNDSPIYYLFGVRDKIGSPAEPTK